MYGQLLRDTEAMNKKVIELLEAIGFDEAVCLMKKVKEVIVDEEPESNAQQSITTVAGTRGQQDMLEKASTAGQFFKVTGDGADYTCDNMLLAIERRGMKEMTERI